MVGLETSNNNNIVLVVILAIMVIVLALILMRKVYTSSQDKREFAKFKEQMIAKLDTGESQISEQAMSKDDPSLDDVQIRS